LCYVVRSCGSCMNAAVLQVCMYAEWFAMISFFPLWQLYINLAKKLDIIFDHFEFRGIYYNQNVGTETT